MNVNHKLQLLDQMDDAAFALMMDEYAESEGERLRAEFEADMRSGLTPHKPDGLDDKCRTIIKKEYGKQRRREYAVKARRFTAKAAAAVLIALGITAATIMSVDALRIPVLNYIVEHHKRYSAFIFDHTEPTETAPANQLTDFVDPLPALLPEGYHEVIYDIMDGRISSMYENETGKYAMFGMIPASGEYWYDTEDAQVSRVMIEGYEAVYIVEDRLQMVWVDDRQNIVYHFVSDGLTEEQFMDICNSLSAYYKDVDIPTEETTPLMNDDPLGIALPADYKLMAQDDSDGLPYRLYKDSDGNVAIIDTSPMSGEYFFDSEAAVVKETSVFGFSAYFLSKDDRLQMIWFDTEKERVYHFTATEFSEDEFTAIAVDIAAHYSE